MRYFLSLVFAASVLLAACGSHPYSFDIGRECSATSRSAIVDAMNEWNKHTTLDHQLNFDGGEWRIDCVQVVTCGYDVGSWNGCEENNPKRVFILAHDDHDFEYAVAMHELGHALGLNHLCTSPALGDQPFAPGAPTCTSTGLGVMDPLNGTGVLSDADLNECRRVGACE